jgi:hypothetical protein
MLINRPATLFLTIGLLVFTTAAQGVLIINTPGTGGDNGGNGQNTGPKTYAILVGAQSPSFGVDNALRGDLDVDHVAAQLNWAEDIKVLKYQWQDFNTVAADIQAAASSIASKIKPEDSFIFYYSGHGTGGSGLGVQDFLNPVQSGACQDNTLTSAFADNHFADVKKFFLIDCCHAEGMWKNDSPDDRDLQTLSNISFLGSSSEDGTAYTNPTTGTSYFTNAILPALTPNATFGELLMTAMSANGNSVTGFFKDDGYGTGNVMAVGHTSADFSPNVQLNGQIAVPEPATFSLLLAATATLIIVRHRRNR